MGLTYVTRFHAFVYHICLVTRFQGCPLAQLLGIMETLERRYWKHGIPGTALLDTWYPWNRVTGHMVWTDSGPMRYGDSSNRI
jgi:hypothetical protein